MPIDTPASLVAEFKKSGEFDRLRREVLARFQQDSSYISLRTRVEEIGLQRLATDQTLQYSSQETVQKELAQEVERYPIVERAVSDVRIFSDPAFLASLESSIQKIIHDESRGLTSLTQEMTSETVRTAETVDFENAKFPEPFPLPESSNIFVPDKLSLPPTLDEGAKMEQIASDLSKAGAAESNTASDSPQITASASHTKPDDLVVDDPHAMDVDVDLPVEQNAS